MPGALNTGGIGAPTPTFLGGQGCHARLKQGLGANEVCDVTHPVPKCMFLGEFTLARVHTHRDASGCTKSEGAPRASSPVHLERKSPSRSRCLLSGPHAVNAVHSFVQEKPWAPRLNGLVAAAAEGHEPREGGRRSCGMSVVRVTGVGAEGASGLGGRRRRPLESSCESPSTRPAACARDLHSPQSSRGSQEASEVTPSAETYSNDMRFAGA